MANWTNESAEADELRKLVDDVENEPMQSKSQEQESQLEQKSKKELPDKDERDHVDILNLPPRRDVHSKSQQRTKLKISRASARLLAVILVLLVLFGTAFYLWGEDLWSSIINM